MMKGDCILILVRGLTSQTWTFLLQYWSQHHGLAKIRRQREVETCTYPSPGLRELDIVAS